MTGTPPYITRMAGVGLATAGNPELVLKPRGYAAPGTLPGIMVLPGRPMDAQAWVPGANRQLKLLGHANSFPGDHLASLADAGHIVQVISGGAGAYGAQTPKWGGPDAMAAMDAAYTRLTSAGGLAAKTGKIGLLGWSMGGGAVLNWAKRNPTKVGAIWCWSAASNLTYWHDNATYTAEIEAAFGGTWAGSVGYRIHDEYASWNGLCPITMAHPSGDTALPYAHSTAFVTGVADPDVTLRTVASPADHWTQWGYVPESEVVDFFKANLV